MDNDNFRMDFITYKLKQRNLEIEIKITNTSDIVELLQKLNFDLVEILDFTFFSILYFRENLLNSTIHDIIKSLSAIISHFLYTDKYLITVVNHDYTFNRLLIKKMPIRKEKKIWGVVDILIEQENLNLVLLNVFPQKTLPLHFHVEMEETEFICNNNLYLLSQDNPPTRLCAGTQFIRQKKEVHGYLNKSDNDLKLLSINNKLFSSRYEIEI